MRGVVLVALVLGGVLLATGTARASDDWTRTFLPDRPVTVGHLELGVGGGVLREARASKSVFVERNAVVAFYSFDLAGGQRTPKDILRLRKKIWRFDGSLKWRDRKRRWFKVDRLAVATGTGAITARVAGKRMRIGTVDKSWFDNVFVEERGQGYWPKRSKGDITVSYRFRTAVKRRLGRSAERLISGSIAISVPNNANVLNDDPTPPKG